MRSDDDELRSIGAEIDKRIDIECLSTDTHLLSKLTASKVAINTEFSSSKRASRHQGSSEIQKDLTENRVIIIAAPIKDLWETLKLLAEGDWIKRSVIAVFVDDIDDLHIFKDSLEAAKKTCTEVVIVKPQTMSRSSSPQRLSSRSPTRSPSRSPVVRSPAREMSPMQSSTKEFSSRTISIPGLPQACSLSTSPGKTRLSYSLDPETVSKKSKRDLVERNVSTPSYRRQESHEYMDTDDTDNYLKNFQRSEIRKDTNEMSKCKSSFRSVTHWDTCDLRQIASLKLEVQVVSIIEQILNLLKNIKMRGEPNASITTLDKLMFEVEGLLSQSVTESGKKMKGEIEKQQLPPKLLDDLLRVNGVYSCGTIYGRLNIHIEIDDGNKKETMQNEVKDILWKYNYRDMEYEMKIVKSRPTTYSSLVICS